MKKITAFRLPRMAFPFLVTRILAIFSAGLYRAAAFIF